MNDNCPNTDDIKVTKVSNTEIKINLPEDTIVKPNLTLQELYHALTDSLVPISHDPSRGCIIQIN